jgi:hypothetical protein
MSRRLSFDHLLALLALGWLGVLAGVPALTEHVEVFAATALLVAVNFSASVWTFLRTRQVLIATNLVQMLLFGTLSFQLAAAFGSEHYLCEETPHFGAWAEFTLAHLLRATDLLDALDDYGVHLQSLRHASTEAGLILVCMHVSADLFLLSLLGRLIWKLWRRLGTSSETTLQRGRRRVLVLMLCSVILGTYLIHATMQQWRRADWLLWPLDNVLRLLDIGDVFQIFDLQLHQVDMDAWTRAYSLAFRFAAGLCLAYVTPWVRLWGFKGQWYTIDELLEFLDADEAVFRAVAARALGEMGPDAVEAIPALRHALRRDPEVSVRCRAATALGRIGPAAAVAVDDLARALVHAHRPLRLRAARALGRIGPGARDARDDLVYLGKYAGYDPGLQKAIFRALERINRRTETRCGICLDTSGRR